MSKDYYYYLLLNNLFKNIRIILIKTYFIIYRELDISPIILMKAIKNEVESAGMMNAHEKEC